MKQKEFAIMYIDIAKLRHLEAGGFLTGREHPYDDLLIWNYTPICQFGKNWTPEALMCRGLITTLDGEVVARPFPKFFNYEEVIAQIPNERFTVTEKMDGSLGILYQYAGYVGIATRGSFESDQAKHATAILHKKYAGFHFETHRTYLFEIIYPNNRIVIDYEDMDDLVLLAVIHTETGQEYNLHEMWETRNGTWPFPIVKNYPGFNDLKKLKEKEESNREGFVVRFEGGMRVKVKFDDYVRLHRLLTGVNARTIWDLLRNKQSFDELLHNVPDEYYQWVRNTRTLLVAQYESMEALAEMIYEQVKDRGTRKEQAAYILERTPKHVTGVVFAMLDGKPYDQIIWKMLKPVGDRTFRPDVDNYVDTYVVRKRRVA